MRMPILLVSLLLSAALAQAADAPPAAFAADFVQTRTVPGFDTPIVSHGNMSYDKAKKQNERSSPNYVSKTTPLLSFTVNGNTDTLASGVMCKEVNGVLQISATSSTTNLAFSISIAGSKTETTSAYEAVIISIAVTYSGSQPTAGFGSMLEINVPCLSGK